MTAAAPSPSIDDRKWMLAAARGLARHPALLPTAIRQLHRLAPAGWWKRWPPLPVPANSYLRFRALTAYGDADRPPDPDDIITWLRWSKAWPGNVRSS